MAQPWLLAGLSWSHLALVLWGIGEVSSTLSQKPPL